MFELFTNFRLSTDPYFRVLEEYKNTYLRIISNYLSHLIGLSSKGNTMYKEKNISQMVINLSY